MEEYNLGFIGKNYAKKQAGERPTTVIVPDKDHNEKEENKNSKNLFFTGDNLEVLRHLQDSYSSSVDFIYIDPPYNTGTKRGYKDNFKFTVEKLMEITGKTKEECKKIKQDTHSVWLAFMYPRLYLAKKLLKDTGVIFVSIDDNEQANLKLLMDDIYGEGNFVANIIRSTGSTRAMAKHFDIRHDYTILYSKNINNLNLFELENVKAKNFRNFDNDKSGPWDTEDMTVRKGGYKYSIPSIDGSEMFIKSWRYSEKELKNLMGFNDDANYDEIYKTAIHIEEKNWYSIGQFVFKGEKNIINNKKYQEKVSTLKNHSLPKNIGSNKGGSNRLKKLFKIENDIFEKPKPIELLEYFFKIAIKKDGVILDFLLVLPLLLMQLCNLMLKMVEIENILWFKFLKI